MGIKGIQQELESEERNIREQIAKLQEQLKKVQNARTALAGAVVIKEQEPPPINMELPREGSIMRDVYDVIKEAGPIKIRNIVDFFKNEFNKDAVYAQIVHIPPKLVKKGLVKASGRGYYVEEKSNILSIANDQRKSS